MGVLYSTGLRYAHMLDSSLGKIAVSTTLLICAFPGSVSQETHSVVLERVVISRGLLAG